MDSAAADLPAGTRSARESENFARRRGKKFELLVPPQQFFVASILILIAGLGMLKGQLDLEVIYKQQDVLKESAVLTHASSDFAKQFTRVAPTLVSNADLLNGREDILLALQTSLSTLDINLCHFFLVEKILNNQRADYETKNKAFLNKFGIENLPPSIRVLLGSGNTANATSHDQYFPISLVFPLSGSDNFLFVDGSTIPAVSELLSGIQTDNSSSCIEWSFNKTTEMLCAFEWKAQNSWLFFTFSPSEIISRTFVAWQSHVISSVAQNLKICTYLNITNDGTGSCVSAFGDTLVVEKDVGIAEISIGMDIVADLETAIFPLDWSFKVLVPKAFIGNFTPNGANRSFLPLTILCLIVAAFIDLYSQNINLKRLRSKLLKNVSRHILPLRGARLSEMEDMRKRPNSFNSTTERTMSLRTSRSESVGSFRTKKRSQNKTVSAEEFFSKSKTSKFVIVKTSSGPSVEKKKRRSSGTTSGTASFSNQIM